MLCSKVSDVVCALPNPAYYVFKYSGTALTCGLALFSRAVAVGDASPLRDPANTTSLGDSSKWTPVPIIPSYLRNRTHALQTTRNGQFFRVGRNDDGGFHPVQEKKGKKNRSLYKIKLRDQRDNLLARATNKDGSPCPPSEPGTGKCKGRAELSNCFPPSLAGVSEKEAEFIRVSKATLNDCSGVIKSGGNARITMEVQFPRLGPAIIFQLHGLPDRWLYKSPDDPNTTYRLPPSTSAETYNSMVENGMRFEQGGYPPLTLAIERDNGKYFLAMTARADYSVFSEKFPRCNMRFSENTTVFNQAKCCNNERDITYIFSKPISTDMDWVKIRIDLKTSDFSTEIPTEGSIKVWINDDMVANSRTYLGVNDAPERGGSGLYAKFGIYRSGDDPVEVRFREPVINTNPDQSSTLETLNPVSVSNTCRPLPQERALESTASPTPTLSSYQASTTLSRSTVLQTGLFAGASITEDLKPIGVTSRQSAIMQEETGVKVSSLSHTLTTSSLATVSTIQSDAITSASSVASVDNRCTCTLSNDAGTKEPTGEESDHTSYSNIINYGLHGLNGLLSLSTLVLVGLGIKKLCHRLPTNNDNAAGLEPADVELELLPQPQGEQDTSV